MTSDEQNETIAVFMGWKREKQPCVCPWPVLWRSPEGRLTWKVPNCYEDLNALAEAELRLTPAQVRTYQRVLRAHLALPELVSAPDRLQLLLKSLNLWKQS